LSKIGEEQAAEDAEDGPPGETIPGSARFLAALIKWNSLLNFKLIANI
jgi:hypothetical protein